MSATADSVFEMAQELSVEDKWSLVERLLEELKGSPSTAKAKPAKAKKDPAAPKKPLTGYQEVVNTIVAPVLKELSESCEAEEKKAMRGMRCRAQIGAALYKAHKDAIDAITKEVVVEAYEAWKLNPPEVKTPKSTASAESKPKAAAAPKPAAKPAAEAAVDAEAVEIKFVEWEHDFGEGMKTYEVAEHNGKKYVYDLESKEYLGVYVARGNKLNKAIRDITAE
jgi:hypothetical protein